MVTPILHGPAYSTYVRSARLAFEEKSVAYELGHFDFMEGFPPEQQARHPLNPVPALTHGDFTLYETVATGRYADEAFDGPSL